MNRITPTGFHWRIPRFRLRTFLVVCALLGTFFGFLARWINHRRFVNKIVLEITLSGGYVFFDSEPDFTPRAEIDSPTTIWLRRRFGDWSFGTPRTVALRGEYALQQLELIENYPSIRHVVLLDADVGTDTIEELRRLASLRAVTIILPSSSTKPGFVGDGVERLRELRQIESLEIVGLNITPALFESIKHLALRTLRMNFCSFGPSELSFDYGAQNLRTLGIEHCRIPSSARFDFSGLTELELLALNSTDIDSASFKTLVQLKKLRKISIYDTPITPDQAAETLQHSPDCEIILE